MKPKRLEKRTENRVSGTKKPIKKREDMISTSDCISTAATLSSICSCPFNVPPLVIGHNALNANFGTTLLVVQNIQTYTIIANHSYV